MLNQLKKTKLKKLYSNSISFTTRIKVYKLNLARITMKTYFMWQRL